jgi:hypothetical protein
VLLELLLKCDEQGRTRGKVYGFYVGFIMADRKCQREKAGNRKGAEGIMIGLQTEEQNRGKRGLLILRTERE